MIGYSTVCGETSTPSIHILRFYLIMTNFPCNNDNATLLKDYDIVLALTTVSRCGISRRLLLAPSSATFPGSDFLKLIVQYVQCTLIFVYSFLGRLLQPMFALEVKKNPDNNKR